MFNVQFVLGVLLFLCQCFHDDAVLVLVLFRDLPSWFYDDNLCMFCSCGPLAPTTVSGIQFLSWTYNTHKGYSGSTPQIRTTRAIKQPGMHCTSYFDLNDKTQQFAANLLKRTSIQLCDVFTLHPSITRPQVTKPEVSMGGRKRGLRRKLKPNKMHCPLPWVLAPFK